MSRARTYRALLIGTTRLEEDPEHLGWLPWPPNDVARLRAALADPEVGLHRPEHVSVHVDETRTQVLGAVEQFLRSARGDDQLLLAYSGHGIADDQRRLHLCASDTMAQFPISTAIPVDAIGAMMDVSAASAIVVLLDCRYSASFHGEDAAGPPAARLAGPRRYVLANAHDAAGPERAASRSMGALTEAVVAGLLADDAGSRSGARGLGARRPEARRPEARLGVPNGTGRAVPDGKEQGVPDGTENEGDGLRSLEELWSFVTAHLDAAGEPAPRRWFDGAGDLPVARAPGLPPLAADGSAVPVEAAALAAGPPGIGGGEPRDEPGFDDVAVEGDAVAVPFEDAPPGVPLGEELAVAGEAAADAPARPGDAPFEDGPAAPAEDTGATAADAAAPWSEGAPAGTGTEWLGDDPEARGSEARGSEARGSEARGSEARLGVPSGTGEGVPSGTGQGVPSGTGSHEPASFGDATDGLEPGDAEAPGGAAGPPVRGRPQRKAWMDAMLTAPQRREVMGWELEFEYLRQESPLAAALLQLCVYLDPRGIPVGLLAAGPDVLPPDLAGVARDRRALDTALATLEEHGFVARSGELVTIPRLVRFAVRSNLGQEGGSAWSGRALSLVGRAFSAPVGGAAQPAWAHPTRLLMHAEAVAGHAEAFGTPIEELPSMLDAIGTHLWSVGRAASARPWFERALETSRQLYGPVDRHVAYAMEKLAAIHREVGDVARAERLHHDAVAMGSALDRGLVRSRTPNGGDEGDPGLL